MEEVVAEKAVMKDFNPNQKNAREDGEIGMADEPNGGREEENQGQGIPCQTQ